MSNSPAYNWPKLEDSFKLWYKALDFDKYSLLFLKKYACHEKIQDGDHFFKMADTSGKEIIKFAKNVPTCPIGMILL